MKIKKTIEIELLVCDVCQKEIEYSGRFCLYCGAAHCLFHTYESGVTYSGIFNPVCIPSGYYCKPCDALLKESKSDQLHNFYQTIARKIEDLKILEHDLSNLHDEYTEIVLQQKTKQ